MLTPEERRLFMTTRSRSEGSDDEATNAANAQGAGEMTSPERLPNEPAERARPVRPQDEAANQSGAESAAARTKGARAKARLPGGKTTRKLETQHAALIIGVVVLLGLTFYVGRKFDYWRYLLNTHITPALPEKTNANLYPGVPFADLIHQGLLAESRGSWQEATQKLIAAKHKDLRYRGILFHVGKLAYDHGDFDAADKAFERAIVFGEDVDLADYFRGLIAVRRRDVPAALRFFEAAANAEPFTADYYFYWGEALRMNHQPNEAITRYAEAGLRSHREQEKAVVQFKIRMARLEAAQASQVSDELDKKKNAGPLPVDWLMTQAALDLRHGNIDQAVQTVYKARAGDEPGLFASCAADMLFFEAGKKYPALAAACGQNPTQNFVYP
jgi:tetratricopeptide (TPR) repeat protein